ncbi:hypothetical protein LGQ10_13055 [Pseudomonas sp. L5B5]|uniref:hypothetical protein n=1 Tax=Pseudomonas sp. L5B5 TaxID=2883205 RepID=UPI001CFAF93C|nr:hypothetical protein [Pseudomonas sp. L5B5]UCZ87179.1 hypothetical protein LGQ10_13055 [Pseudomonas sp. L5B5]
MSELTILHDAIAATIKAAMPAVQAVEAFPEAPDGMPRPAIVFAITAMDPATDPGDGRSCVKATFEASMLVDASLPGAALQAVELAAQMADLLHCQHWNLDFVEGTTSVRAKPADATSESWRKKAWTVQWQQQVFLGQEQWPWANQGPESLLLGFGPDTGPGHNDDYFSPGQQA